MLNCNVKTDNYGYFTFDTPKLGDGPDLSKFSLSFMYPHDDIPLTCGGNSKESPTAFLNPVFFEKKCQVNDDGTRSLILDGKKIFQEIGLRNHHELLFFFHHVLVLNKKSFFSGDISSTPIFPFY